MDWNNDGKKDLLTGENYGYIRIYLNTGTDANPSFSGYTYLQVGGSNFDAGTYSWIHVADWNNDGLWDVLSGESYGKLWLMINEGTPGSPLFNSKSYVQNGIVDLDVGNRSSPTVVDWNRDGKKDLLLGESGGTIRFYENKNTDADPEFNGYVTLQLAGGSLLDVGYDAHPDVADWNNDGVMDIITGEFYGTVPFFKAIGPLDFSDNKISEITGGSIDFSLNAGLANGNRDYIILGSVSGTSPGIPLPGGMTVLPVNWDIFTNVVIGSLNTPIFQNFMGTLDGNGKAVAKLRLAFPLPGLAGLVMSYAFALNKPWDYASNGGSIEIVP